ncbi:MAG: type II toxin-antitoxin system VapC family toxin [Burkholderiales bacterium]
MYLVDTSVWIDFRRGRNAAHVTALRALLEQDEVVGIAPMILQEILQGADSEARFERWRTHFADLFCYIPADLEACHVEAARLYQRCRRTGKTPRSSNDCVIARMAVEFGLMLLHNDRDFQIIADLEPALHLSATR